MDRDDLILAYVQGKLSDADSTAFEQDLEQDANMAAELLALRAARSEFAQEDDQVEADAGWSRLEATINATIPANDNRPLRLSLWQTGALIAASLVLWQVAVVPFTQPQRAPGYEAVSEATRGAVLQVMFSATASVAEVTALLRVIGGTVVEGPGALGLYRIAFESSNRMEVARAVLEGRRDLIDLVTVE
ncbi:hypothetical protein [Tritonibacter horizontis]|uniref:Uncharacterized protein n=1 Tax=Tritonibacter horizontis TaxID=1768241 RepID=A0A132BWW1_9RHOB|nr:hypothetical protein [Tritonibacter horizontis]KUP92879.1 hypothetical protein TRIHO_23300 [Tritonibacter horizontis]